MSIKHSNSRKQLSKRRRRSHSSSSGTQKNRGGMVSLNSFRNEISRNPELFTSYWSNHSSTLSDTDRELFTISSNATYGYMAVGGFQTILNKYLGSSGQQYPSVFYDLGSGMGNPTLMAGIFIPTLTSANGIELSTNRHNVAVEVMKNISSKNKVNLKNVHFFNDSILSEKYNYGDANMIWISSLCFSADLVAKLTEKLNSELRPGTQVFTSQALPNLNHSHHSTFTAQMSWEQNSNVNHYII